MRLILVFLSLAILAFSQKADCDPRLVGRWMMLFTKDASGEIVKDEFYGKKYIETYTKDGRWIPDPQIFRVMQKSMELKPPLITPPFLLFNGIQLIIKLSR